MQSVLDRTETPVTNDKTPCLCRFNDADEPVRQCMVHKTQANRIESLQAELQQSQEIRGDMEIVLKLVAEKLKVPDEPHQVWQERLFETLDLVVAERDRYREAVEEIERSPKDMRCCCCGHDFSTAHQALKGQK